MRHPLVLAIDLAKPANEPYRKLLEEAEVFSKGGRPQVGTDGAGS